MPSSLREIRIRMRRVATECPVTRTEAARSIARSNKPEHRSTRCSRSRGQTADDTLEAILHESGKAYAIEIAPLRRAHEEPKLAFQTLARLLDAALADVDSREEGERQAT